MNHEALNMTNTTDQTTEVTKKVEAEPRPLLLFQKLGATANALVAKAKEYREEKKEEMHERVRNQHPEIFNQINEEAIDALQSGYLEKLKEVDWREVISTYQNAYNIPREMSSQIHLMNEDGNVVNILSKELNIKKELHGYYPELDSKENLESSYRTEGLMRKKGRIKLSNTMISIDGFSLMREHDDYNKENEFVWKGIARVGTIAHEMWHVFQETDNATPDRNKMYKVNQKHYISGGENPDRYQSQLVEKEANRFENEVEKIIIDQIFPEQKNNE